MTVITVGKIQVRKGLQEDLPNLSAGEFGWSVDSQRLYIGNGTTAEGAPQTGVTEILTGKDNNIISLVANYTFDGSETGYTSQTGPGANTPVIRQLQEKLDDRVDLRDFIADSNRDTDDYTSAFERAIFETRPTTILDNFALRRTIYVPAGEFPISDTVYLPPYVRLVGDGIESTRIVQTAGVAAFSVSDQAGETGASMSGQFPQDITVSNMTIACETAVEAFDCDSASDVLFTNVSFVGNNTTPATLGSATAILRVAASYASANRITFRNCRFSDSAVGANVLGDSTGILFDNCAFSNLYNGVIVEGVDVDNPRAVRVVASQFDNIASEAIVSADDSQVTSAFNYFNNTVGYGDGVEVTTATVSSSIVSFNTSDNYSIGDTFRRTSADVAAFPPIVVTGTEAPLTNLVLTTVSGALQTGPGVTETLPDNTGADTGLSLGSSATNLIEYAILRGDERRCGTIRVSQSPAGIFFDEEYSETADVGVTLDFSDNPEGATLNYAVSSTGTDAVIKYTVRSFI